MDLRLRLRVILDRVSISALELALQPEAFQATEELRLAAGDLAEILDDLDRETVSETPHKTVTNAGTVRALDSGELLAA